MSNESDDGQALVGLGVAVVASLPIWWLIVQAVRRVAS